MDKHKPTKPTGTFAESMAEEPQNMLSTSGGSSFKVELFANGSSIGWLGQNDGQWCLVVGKDTATSLEPYVWKGVTYYRNATRKDRYLSVNNRWHYVGFYNWYGATGWTLSGNVLSSQYTNAPLSYWSSEDGWIYANDGNGFTPLTVKFHD